MRKIVKKIINIVQEMTVTKEQEAFRKNILKGRYQKAPRKYRVKEVIEKDPYNSWTPWQKSCYCLKNCFWWIRELTENGNGFPLDKKRTLETLSAIEEHCKTMRNLLTTKL